ncbi:MAG: hypothetical protein AB1938_23405 [Myxococcota bacterium]
MAAVKPSNGIKAFDAIWNKARADGSKQGHKVAYEELKEAISALQTRGISRYEAAHAAATLASDPVLTGPAAKEAYAFLKTIGAGKLDNASIEAVKAEFSLRATAPFKSLSVPGKTVRNTVDLPDSVQKALGETHEKDADANWESVVAKKATLAGQPVFIVHYSSLDDGNMDAEKVKVFSAAGKPIAKGSLFDGMAGFLWE